MQISESRPASRFRRCRAPSDSIVPRRRTARSGVPTSPGFTRATPSATTSSTLRSAKGSRSSSPTLTSKEWSRKFPLLVVVSLSPCATAQLMPERAEDDIEKEGADHVRHDTTGSNLSSNRLNMKYIQRYIMPVKEEEEKERKFFASPCSRAHVQPTTC